MAAGSRESEPNVFPLNYFKGRWLVLIILVFVVFHYLKQALLPPSQFSHITKLVASFTVDSKLDIE